MFFILRIPFSGIIIHTTQNGMIEYNRFSLKSLLYSGAMVIIYRMISSEAGFTGSRKPIKGSRELFSLAS